MAGLLHDVIAHPWISCQEYVLRRLGLPVVIEPTLAGFLKNFLPSNGNLVRGDVLVWDHRKQTILAPLTLQKERIISTTFDIDYHVAVYEGDGMFSDVTYPDMRNETYRMIAFRLLSDIKNPYSGVYCAPIRPDEINRG